MTETLTNKASATQGHVVVFGSGRSGTTWVQDALAKANNFATVFEPLHPDAVPGAGRYANLYVRTGTHDLDLSAFIQAALDGTLAPLWTRLRTRGNRLHPDLRTLLSVRGLRDLRASYAKLMRAWRTHGRNRGRPKVVKFIRGNLLAEWLVTQFKVRGAVIVRHPCAVLSSVLQRHGNEWEQPAMAALLQRYLQQPDLVNDRLRDYAPALAELRSFAEVHTAVWCIENAAFISRNTISPIAVAHYERLIATPGPEWRRLTSLLGLDFVPDRPVLERPSQQASYKALRSASSESFLAGWQDVLNEQQLADAAGVLKLFGVTTYNTRDSMPMDDSGLLVPFAQADRADRQ